MRHSSARAVYSALIALHPRNFRKAFAGELLATFDEAVESYGAAWLLWEIAGSVLRQHILREPEPEYEIAPCCAVGLRSGIYPLVGPYEYLLRKLLLASLLTSILFRLVGPI